MGRPRLNFPRHPGPTGRQALRGYIKMISNGETFENTLKKFLDRNHISYHTGFHWVHHGHKPQGDKIRHISYMTNGWVTSREWYGDCPMQSKWKKNRHLWEGEKP